jgi:transcription-repair coupling factor (superfamily II helicase)
MMGGMSCEIPCLPNISAVAWTIAQGSFLKSPLEGSAVTVLVSDSDLAQDLAQEIDAIFAIPGFCETLIALETNLVRHRGPSLSSKHSRLRALAALHYGKEEKPSRVVIVAADALCQPVPSQQAFKKMFFKISVGSRLSRSDVVPKLVELAYLPVEIVESKGTFAARGSIIDLFCPTLDSPVRIELFGDEVQSIRSFDPKTQRKVLDIEAIGIGPAQEFFFTENKEHNISTFKNYADAKDWLRSDRNEMLDRVQNLAHFSTLDFWARVFTPKDYCFIHELFHETSLRSFDWVLNSQACVHGAKLSRTTQVNDLIKARAENEWVPAPEDFVDNNPSFDTDISQIISKSSRELKFGARSEESAVESNSALATKIASARAQQEVSPLQPLYDQVKIYEEGGIQILFTSPTLSQLERLEFFLGSQAIKLSFFDSIVEATRAKSRFAGVVTRLDSGFFDRENKVCVLTDEEIFGKRKRRSTITTKKSAASVFSNNDLSLLSLEPGDYVVQSEHGVGIYLGLKSMRLDGITSELIELEYAGQTKLFVPVSRLNTVQRLGGKETQTALDKLGGQSWDAKKTKAKKDIRSIATELIQLYSKRQLSVGPKINPSEDDLVRFASTFAFEETPDQAKAIEDSILDIRGPKPMDRVLCGDVGYGKTEVALRTAHAALAAGFQVAVLVPTTILASQHELVFKKRLAPLGYNVRGVSRFKDAKDFKEVTEGLRSGQVHLVVGTHRLLSDQVSFKNLGFMVIDEEQRFGVTHKEKLKRFKNNVHVLTMTATPIPRTLNMALSGLRELSIISTPPVDRLSVKTYITRKKPSLVQEAIRNELARDGQVFYLHNRVQDIHLIEAEVKELVPEAKISVVHGQLEEKLLEERMVEFYEGRTQVLITTTIIESGLDVPNANTLIVERANNFGLSQLYQIRGRVGRSSQKAYAYFLLPPSGAITKDAEERLQVLETYQDLGSGFHIASHDLDIRGAGDLLGRSQSGHMHAIGFDTYVSLLQECVSELQGEPLESNVDPEINIPIESNIPAEYIPDIGLRLTYYKKLASADGDSVFMEIEEELEDRFGRPPQSVFNLLRIMKIKSLLRRLGVKSLTSGKVGYSLVFDASTPVNTEKLVEKISKYPQHYSISSDEKLVIKMPGGLGSPSEMLKMAESALEHLSNLA